MPKLRKQTVAVAGLACATAFFLSGSGATAQNLRLSVNPYSGVVTIDNPSTTTPVSLDSYQITSASNQLVPDPTHTLGVGWDSLADAGLTGWEQVAPSAGALSELNISSSTSIPAASSISLGHAFTPNGTTDVQWGYTVPGNTLHLPAALRYAGGLQIQVVALLSNHGSSVESTKAVLLNQEASTSFAVDAYTVRSAAGNLNPAGFSSFAAHHVAGWESVAPSANALSELNLSSSTTLSPGHYQMLGSAVTTGATHDLTLEFHLVGQGATVLNGIAFYKNQLAGDANNDGIVDVSDIQSIAATYLQNSLLADTNYDGIVDVSDIQVIAAHYLNTLGAGSGMGSTAAVPEPNTLALLSIGLLGAGGCACRTWRRPERA